MSAINYDERIPNSVDLSSDRRLQRAGKMATRLHRLVELGRAPSFQNNEIFSPHRHQY